jgi:hypothetical protein
MPSKRDDIAWHTERLLSHLRAAARITEFIEQHEAQDRHAGWQRVREILVMVATAVEQQ